jgi:glycosyltransferase involved in cell wall biosynthesis
MFVTNSLSGGGAERSMNVVCEELAARGWPVLLVPINKSQPDLVIPNSEILCVNREWQSGFFGTIVSLFRFTAFVKSWKPEVIVLNCDLPELYGSTIPSSCEIIVVEHANPAWSTRSFLGKIVRLILNFRGAKWVAVSSHLTIWPNGDQPDQIIQNPITPVTKLKAIIDSGGSAKRIVYIGRLSAEKQPQKILEIACLTQDEVLVVGEGTMRSSLEMGAIKSGVKATFSGFVGNPWNLIEHDDLLIVPSAREGDGLVVIEAIQNRIPLLLSDIPDFRRFSLPDRNYCKSESDFADRINEYRENLSLLIISEEISNPILEPRSPEIIVNTWESYLDTV